MIIYSGIFTETGCNDQVFSLSKLQMELEMLGEAMKTLACYFLTRQQELLWICPV